MKALLIFIIIMVTILMKVLADVYRYYFEKDKEKEDGILYHIFGMVVPLIPFAFAFICFEPYQILILLASYLCIYALIMNVAYNIFTGKNILYLGLTDGVDLFLRKLFKISNEFSEEYKLITPKQKQRENFRKFIILWLRVLVFTFGIYLIQTYLN